MSDTAMVALGTLAFLIVSGAAGWFWSIIVRVNSRLTELSNSTIRNHNSLVVMVRDLLDTHERRDQDRHEEVIQRLTRVETVVLNGNSYPIKKKIR